MEPETAEPRSGGVNLDFRAFLAWLKRWKVVVGGVTLLAIAYAGITGMREKPVYGAEARILMTSLEGDASNPLDIILSGDNSVALNMLRGVLESRTTRKMIATKAGVPFEDVKKKLTILPEPQLKQIIIQSRKFSSEKNLQIVQATLDVLEQRSAELQIGPAGKQAELIKQTLTTREGELAKAEDELANYSKTMISGPDASATFAQLRQIELEYGAAVKALESAEEQVRAAGQSLEVPTFLPGTAELKATITERRLALATLQQTYGPGHPQIVRARRDLQIAEQTLNAEVQKYLRSVNSNIDPVTAELAGKKTVLEWQLEEARKRAKLAPEEAMTFARLTREVGILNGVVTDLRAQYEKAMIQADTEKLTWTILDAPELREEQENGLFSKLVKYTLGGFALGLLAAWILGGLVAPRKRSA